MEIKNSALEHWLRRMCMSTEQFCELVGCSRPIAWKVKRGIPIDTKYCKRIFSITNGEVSPLCNPKGRPKGYSQKLKKFVL